MEYWKVVLSNYLHSEETLWLMNLKSDAAQSFQGDFWRNRLITLFWCSTEIGKYAQQLFLCNSNIFIWGLAAHIVQTLAADLSPLFEANLTNSFFLQIPIWGIWGHYCKQSKQIFEIKYTWILLVSDTDAVGILPVYHSSQQKDTSHFTSFLVVSFLLFYSFSSFVSSVLSLLLLVLWLLRPW